MRRTIPLAVAALAAVLGVTSDVVAGPGGSTYALSGGLAALLAGKPDNGFTLTRVDVD